MAVIRMIPFDLLGSLWRKTVDDKLAMWWKDLVTAKLLDSPHKATVETTCGSLVALVCNSDMPEVVYGAFWALSRVPHLKFPPVMTRLSVEARLLARFADMLEAPNTSEWHYPLIFEILSHLALHESSAVATVETSILKSIENLPRSSHIHLHRDIYQILRNLVSHESTATAVLDMCRLLATLWRESLETDTYSTYSTIQAIGTVIGMLTRIASFPGGAEGVVTAKLLNDVRNGLRSTSYLIQSSTCDLLRELVGHESVVQAVVVAVPREDIVALLSPQDHNGAHSRHVSVGRTPSDARTNPPARPSRAVTSSSAREQHRSPFTSSSIALRRMVELQINEPGRVARKVMAGLSSETGAFEVARGQGAMSIVASGVVDVQGARALRRTVMVAVEVASPLVLPPPAQRFGSVEGHGVAEDGGRRRDVRRPFLIASQHPASSIAVPDPGSAA
ncbi:hypothetical protein C8J57DRAFT_1533018 [Mycena rebaudengoi]|nr:hypothetical protein C8J57DRAFT_1533018 [Mycena rebaudengoi]